MSDENLAVHPDSPFALACRRYGLDPQTTSYALLASTKLGHDHALATHEIEKQAGPNWTHWACQ